MLSDLKINKDELKIFHELKKRRIYVGGLIYDRKREVFKLIYDNHYIKSKNAIPLGPELNLFKNEYISKKGQLFSVFQDRIPVKSNPAYKDYCASQGISVNETNPIILLGSIGRRGPSSFIFEPVYESNFLISDITKMRQQLNISQNDLAAAFGIKEVTLQRIESGISNDHNTIKLLQIYLSFPKVAIWQLQQTGSHVHSSVLARLLQYFQTDIH